MSCPVCGGSDIQALVHQNQCINCGTLLDQEGKEAEGGPDQSTLDAITSRLGRREHNIVGNLADLQRLGAEVVSPGKTDIDGAFPVPPGANPDKMPKAEADTSAKATVKAGK
jgi:hypothetical protein